MVRSVVVLCCFLCIIDSLCANHNITIDQELRSGCEQATAGDVILCGDLDSAILYAVTLNTSYEAQSTNDSITISLPNGVHYVTSQTYFGDANVKFVGLDHNVMVLCEYYADNETFDATQIHTWYFNQSSSIEMENIHFKNCGFPFRFTFVDSVNVSNCTYTNFSEAVLDIYNCHNVILCQVMFSNNSGNGRLLEAVRGNSGSVAIGYNVMPAEYTNPTLIVSSCVFRNNKALGFLSPERAVTGQVFLGRGGALALYMNESSHDINVEISDCVFDNNVARLFGGGLYILTTSYTSVQHIVKVKRTLFSDNVGKSGGGGIQFSTLSAGDVNRPHDFMFSDCTFEGNKGESGGGIYVFIDDNGNRVHLRRCNFTSNSGMGSQNDLGAAGAFSYLVRFTQRVTSTQQEVTNCSFVNNSGPNGVMSIGYSPMRFSGLNSFINNVGASLRIVGSLVDFSGEMEFTNNSASGEGVLSLLSFAQMRLHRGTYFRFSGNIGRLGSSIVVDTLASLFSFDDLLFNPRCFILYENRTATPSEWSNVGISFANNEALVSSGVYLSQRGNICSWFKQTPPFFNSTFLPDWPLWSYEDNINSGHLDSHNQLLSFGTTAQQFTLQPSNVSAWPGQKVTLSLVGLDGFNHYTSTNTRFMFQPFDQSISADKLQLDPEIIVLAGSEESQGLLRSNFSFSYSVASLNSMEEDEGKPLGRVITEEAFEHNPIVSNDFTLFTRSCPEGYAMMTVPNSDTMTCTCVSTIEEILICESDQDSVIMKHGTWAIYNPSDASSANLFFHPCPPGYCSCNFNSSLVQSNRSNKMCTYQYKQSNPDSQCVCNRKGILCGKCNDGLGVSILLNKCVSCSDGYLALIPLLIFLVAAVLVTIILADRPLPDWIIPFLFYIQNAPYATLFYPETFESVGKYLYFMSSATSLYFVYDFCLSSSLAMTHSFLLRYFPACTALLVFFMVWLIRKKLMKRKSLLNYACWWFLLLLYSSVVYTSMSALHCTSVPNSESNSRWFLSGDTECFSGAHAVLGLLAIVMLVVCIFFTVLAASLPSMKLSIFKNYKRPFSNSFKDKYSYWSGIELGRRFVFLLALVPFPRNTVYAVFVLVISICLYAYNMPYKSRLANILELVVQLNFLLLLLLELAPFIKEDLFVFDGETSGGNCNNVFSEVSNIVVLLAPIYYAPLLLIVVVAVGYLVVYIHRYLKRSRQNTATVAVDLDHSPVRSTSYTTQSIDIDYSQEFLQ